MRTYYCFHALCLSVIIHITYWIYEDHLYRVLKNTKFLRYLSKLMLQRLLNVCKIIIIILQLCVYVLLYHWDHFVQGWLVDLINLFGEHGGFEKFRDRILKGTALNASIIAAMIRWVIIRSTIRIYCALVLHVRMCWTT